MPEHHVDVIVWSPGLGGAVDTAFEVLNAAQRQFRFLPRRGRALHVPKDGVHSWSQMDKALAAEKRRRPVEFLFGVLERPIEANWYSRTVHAARICYITTADWEWLTNLPVSAYIAYEIVENLAEMLLGRLHFHTETQGCLFDFCQNKPEISFKIRTGDICRDCVAFMRGAVGEETVASLVEMLEGTRRLALGRVARASTDERTFAERIDQSYPFPIAHCYRCMTGEPLFSQKWKRMVNLVEVSLKYTCFVLMANLLDHSSPGKLPCDLRRAMIGGWAHAMYDLLDANRSNGGPSFLDGFLCRVEDAQLEAVRRDIKFLTETRNDTIGHGYTQEEAAYQSVCSDARMPLQNLLAFLEPLAHYRLVKPGDMSVRRGRRSFHAKVLMGSHPDFPVERMETRADVETACTLQHPVEDRFLAMDRWIMHEACHECQRQTVFLYEKLHDEHVYMREYPNNHMTTRTEAYDELARLFGVRRRKRAQEETAPQEGPMPPRTNLPPMHHNRFTAALLALAVIFVLASATVPALADTFTSRDKEAVIYAVHQVVGATASVQIQKTAGGYARAQVTMAGTDPARVYLHKVGGRWKVIAGPGTAWTPQEYARLGIPPSVR